MQPSEAAPHTYRASAELCRLQPTEGKDDAINAEILNCLSVSSLLGAPKIEIGKSDSFRPACSARVFSSFCASGKAFGVTPTGIHPSQYRRPDQCLSGSSASKIGGFGFCAGFGWLHILSN